jgi:hypothetical protein
MAGFCDPIEIIGFFSVLHHYDHSILATCLMISMGDVGGEGVTDGVGEHRLEVLLIAFSMISRSEGVGEAVCDVIRASSFIG